MPKNAHTYECSQCNFICSKLSNYNTHIATAKHQARTNCNNLEQVTAIKPKPMFTCTCGKQYTARNSLWYHKRKCNITDKDATKCPPLENTFVTIEDKRDKIIEAILKDSLEMKNLIVMLVQNQQEVSKSQQEVSQTLVQSLAQKHGDVSIVGNTTNTNSHNNTLNFYLTQTCKDAESIHDFTDRFVARSIEFFKDNFRKVASNQVDLAASVYDIMNKCLDEKPQIEKFIQTTDVKNGVLYVKEKKKDEQRQFYGEAEFVKHMDGFEKTGINLEHAINKVFFPMKDEFTELMKMECGSAPREDNFDDDDDFEDELYKYKERVTEVKRNMCLQIYNTSTVFDKKHLRDLILARTKRRAGGGAPPATPSTTNIP